MILSDRSQGDVTFLGEGFFISCDMSDHDVFICSEIER